jgi:hypothetical protein
VCQDKIHSQFHQSCSLGADVHADFHQPFPGVSDWLKLLGVFILKFHDLLKVQSSKVENKPWAGAIEFGSLPLKTDGGHTCFIATVVMEVQYCIARMTPSVELLVALAL